MRKLQQLILLILILSTYAYSQDLPLIQIEGSKWEYLSYGPEGPAIRELLYVDGTRELDH